MTTASGVKLDDWRCGRVLYRGSRTLGVPPITCMKFVKWIPQIHIHREGAEDCHVLMGAHSLCDACKLKFKIEELESYEMWQTVLGQFRADGRPDPRRKDIEIEWFSVEDYLKAISM